MAESDLKKAVNEYQACVKIHEVWDDLKKAVCDFDALVRREEENHKKIVSFGVWRGVAIVPPIARPFDGVGCQRSSSSTAHVRSTASRREVLVIRTFTFF